VPKGLAPGQGQVGGGGGSGFGSEEFIQQPSNDFGSVAESPTSRRRRFEFDRIDLDLARSARERAAQDSPGPAGRGSSK
jgi:hypothetical protein